MGRFACVALLATTQCSLGLAALAADLPPRIEPVPPVPHVYLETLSTSHSWVRCSSFDRPSQSSAGRKRIDWDWQAPGA